MSRFHLVLIWAFITLITPILLLAMLLQAVAGSQRRAMAMAVAYDEFGNSLLGGDPNETISRRTGLAAIAGKRWARWAVPLIDGIFGAGHCAANAADPE